MNEELGRRAIRNCLNKLRKGGHKIERELAPLTTPVFHDVKVHGPVGLGQSLCPLDIFFHHHNDFGAGDSLAPLLWARLRSFQVRPCGHNRHAEIKRDALELLCYQRKAGQSRDRGPAGCRLGSGSDSKSPAPGRRSLVPPLLSQAARETTPAHPLQNEVVVYPP